MYVVNLTGIIACIILSALFNSQWWLYIAALLVAINTFVWWLERCEDKDERNEEM